jgi:Ni,Fe-hydrogenase maturation factor
MEIETVIIGVEPEIMNWGMELTEEVKKRIPFIIEAVLKES